MNHTDAEYQALGYRDARDAAECIIRDSHTGCSASQDEVERWSSRLLNTARVSGGSMEWTWNWLGHQIEKTLPGCTIAEKAAGKTSQS